MDLTSPRFAMVPLFLLAATFSLLAPLYWTHVEAPAQDTVAGAYENQEIYGRLLPALDYGYTRMRAGDWPLWSPNLYCGVPYFANPVHGLLQPLNAVFFLTPPIQGLALHAFLGLFLMAMFLAIYLRALGAAYIPAAIGGMVYAFCGASAAAMSRPELLGVLAWTPLLYWILYEYTGMARAGWIVPGGLVVAAMLLTGAPMFAAVMVAGALMYGVAKAVARGRTSGTGWKMPLKGILAMAALGLVYSAVQWAPFLTWLAALDSPMQALWQWSGTGYLPENVREVPSAILASRNAILPGMLYFGAISMMVMPAALLHRQRRFEVLFFLAAAVVWIGISVWGFEPAAGAGYGMMLAYPGVVAVAALVGLGADRLLLAGRDPRSPLIWGSVLLVLAAAAVLLAAGSASIRGPVALATIALLPFFILRVRWLGVICGTCVAFLIYVELRDASANIYQHPYAGDRNWLQPSLPALKEAEAQALGERIFVLPGSRETVLPANVGWLQPLENAGGAYWPLTADQAAWWSKLAPYLSATGPPSPAEGGDTAPFYPELLNYMGVRVLIGEHKYPWMDRAGEDGRLRLRFLRPMGRLKIWRNESAYDRVRWVPHWEPARGVDEAMGRLLAPSFSGQYSCVVDAGSRGFAALNKALPPGIPEDGGLVLADAHAAVKLDRPEDLVIETDATQPGILVVSDTNDPGWRAYVDGNSAPILQVNGLFRGIFVPAGDHTVILSYAPLSVTLGLLVSVCGLLLSVLWLLFACIRWLYAAIRGSNVQTVEQPPARPTAIQEFRR